MNPSEPKPHPLRPPAGPYLVLGVGLLAALSFLTIYPFLSFDTYLHLATGEWILKHGAVPRHNLFMYTAPDHPYINHTWLSQLLVTLVHRAFGFAGLQVLTFVGFSAAFGLVLWLWRRLGVGAHLAAVPFLLALLLPLGRYQPRPELFSNLFLALTLCALLTWRESNHRALWGLPAVVAFWVNCHGAVTSGVALLWIFVAGEGIQATLARRWPAPWLPALPFRRWRTLALVTVAASAALVVNPYGLGWFEAVSPARLRFLATIMKEWEPLLRRDPQSGTSLGLILAFMALALLSFLFTRRLYLSNLAATIAFIAALFASERNSMLCALVLLAMMGSNLSARAWPRPLGRLAPSPRWARPALAAAALLFWLTLVAFAWGEPSLRWLSRETQSRPGFGIADDVIPVRAERFWRTKGLPDRLFTTIPYSSYVIWTHPQGRPVFIDGHNAFGRDVILQFWAVFLFGPKDDALIRRWNINTFMLPKPDPTGPDLAGKREFFSWLARSPRWRLVFWDGVSVIYVRDASQHRALLDRYGYTYLDPGNPQSPAYSEHPHEVDAELRRATAASPDSPHLRLFAGFTYLGLEMLDRAAAEFAEALRLMPHSADAHAGLGLVALQAGDHQQAEPMFHRAARLAPEDPRPHRFLAQIARAQGDLRRAAAEWHRAVRRSPTSVGDRVALAQAHEAAGDPGRAARAWRSVLAMNPDAETAALAQERLDALSGR